MTAKRNIVQIDYDLLKSAKNVITRSSSDCHCSICKIGRMNGLEYKQYLQTKPVPGRPCQVDKPTAENILMCNLCLTHIGKGLPHDCHNTSLKENIHDIVQNFPTKVQEQIASNLLKNIGNLHEGKGAVAKLSTGGTPLTVQVGCGDKNKTPPVSFEELNHLQMSRNFSDNDTLAVANFYRVKNGRNSIEPNLKNHLIERNNRLAPFFTQKVMTFKEKAKKKSKTEQANSENTFLDENGCYDIVRTAVFVKDVKEFTNVIMESRGLEEEKHVIQFGFDDGQGMLKLMQTIKSSEVVVDQPKKRAKYSDGVCPKTNKLSSVKRLFIIGIVAKVSELYSNIKLILNEVKLLGVHYGFSADIKMYLVIVGKQTASAVHSCPYCEGREPWIDNCILSSIRSLRYWHNKFVENRSVMKNAQHFKNVINEPLLLGDENTLVLEKLNIPELHCLMGSVFKICLLYTSPSPRDS